MPRYLLLETGKETTFHDPHRGVWYSAKGECGYWTDDWGSLNKTNGIPCCPHCSMVGMQVTYYEWLEGAKKFEMDNHPRYLEYLSERKNVCCARLGKDFLQQYEEWLIENA